MVRDKKMNYLKICEIISCDELSHHCVGRVNPKLYSEWKSINSQILFYEGIHQFAVKAVKRINVENKNKKLVPAQIKNFISHLKPSHEAFYVAGRVDQSGAFYRVEFKVFYCLEQMKINQAVASGIIAVASLSYS